MSLNYSLENIECVGEDLSLGALAAKRARLLDKFLSDKFYNLIKYHDTSWSNKHIYYWTVKAADDEIFYLKTELGSKIFVKQIMFSYRESNSENSALQDGYSMFDNFELSFTGIVRFNAFESRPNRVIALKLIYSGGKYKITNTEYINNKSYISPKDWYIFRCWKSNDLVKFFLKILYITNPVVKPVYYLDL